MSSKTVGTYALITVDNVKDYYGLVGANDDTLIMDLIDRATAQFETYCSRQFESRERTEEYDGNGTKYLFPKYYPITTISGILDDSDWAWGSTTEIDSTTYRIQNENTVVRKPGNVFTKGDQNIRITYTAGYADGSIPADLVQAAIEEVVRMYKRRAEVDVLAKTADDGSVTRVAKEFLPTTLRVLDKYMLKSIRS